VGEWESERVRGIRFRPKTVEGRVKAEGLFTSLSNTNLHYTTLKNFKNTRGELIDAYNVYVYLMCF